jgi:hypothetical protein
LGEVVGSVKDEQRDHPVYTMEVDIGEDLLVTSAMPLIPHVMYPTASGTGGRRDEWNALPALA